MIKESGLMNEQSEVDARQAYWKANLRLVGWCLLTWFLVSFGFGILLVEELNRVAFFGFKLGFWFAQQGSIFAFLVLIFFYAWRMNALDQKFGVEEHRAGEGEASQ
jgi:putative solute:sodium symporter small subunit